MKAYESWGRYPRSEPARVIPLFWANEPLPERAAGDSLLAFGQGRSYGDSCLNNGGTLLDTASLARFISFDADAGRLRCEAGITFDEILDVIVPRGWFLPVSPGTRFVSLGGAIANDVHGKNHHVAGTFGTHVTRLAMLVRPKESLLTAVSAVAQVGRVFSPRGFPRLVERPRGRGTSRGDAIRVPSPPA